MGMATSQPVKFGTSGLRGRAAGFTPHLVAAYVGAFLDACCKGASVRDVAIGTDLRSSSPEIAAAVVGAVAAQAWSPIYCGALPTPALAAFALDRSIPAIIVTGSHIPAEYNGLKFYRPQGELTKDDEDPIEHGVAHLLAVESGPILDTGASLPAIAPEAIRVYRQRFIEGFPSGAISGLRVGVFEHSAVGRDLLVDVLKQLGAQVTRFGRSETFIAVDTEAVEPEHLALVRSALARYGLDAVVSTDGDGDRPLVIDERGDQINGDVLGALTARFLGTRTLATPITSTSAIEQSGWFRHVTRTRIGSPYVVAAMETETALSVAGFEANGGFLTHTDFDLEQGRLKRLPTRDAMLPIVAVLADARAKDRRLSELVSDLPLRVMRADRLKNVWQELSRLLIASLATSRPAREELDPRLANPTDIDTLDGTRLTLADGTIVHFRPSGNAPELRCYVESDSSQRTEETLKTMIDRLDRYFRQQSVQ